MSEAMQRDSLRLEGRFKQMLAEQRAILAMSSKREENGAARPMHDHRLSRRDALAHLHERNS